MTLTNGFDWLGSALSLCSTLLFIRADIRAWPFGLAATVVNTILYAHLGIYGDMSLEACYFFAMIYGWYAWLHGGRNHSELNIAHVSWQHAAILIALVVLGMWGIEHFLKADTNSQVPYLDSFTTVIALTAQWLTCRKIMESWILWFAADVVYTGLFIYKGIPVHAGVHAFYLLLAILGYWRWWKLKPKDFELTPSDFVN